MTHSPRPNVGWSLRSGRWSVVETARRIAEVHAELLLIHPFREGNGRLSRWLAGLMVIQAGYPPPLFRFTGKGSQKEKQRYLWSVVRGYQSDFGPLTDLFTEAIGRRT